MSSVTTSPTISSVAALTRSGVSSQAYANSGWILSLAQRKPVYGVLLDMVGDADPLFVQEDWSVQRANVVVQKVWGAAARLGYQP